ncbi:MAG: contractile injection system tape measure protein [Pseudomonadota bacterium]
MRNRHLVDTAVFNIGFSDEETAFQIQSEFESFIKQKMMTVLDEVFDAASEAGLVMRMPSLEVDLGSVALPDYQSEMPRRLRERLTALLTEYRVTTSGRQSSDSCVIEPRLADYEQLEYFLLHGYLPWYSSLDDELDLAGLLEGSLHDNALRLKNFLQSTAHRHHVLARLVSQFPLPGIVQLFHSLAPAHAHPVSELMDDLRQTWHRHDSILISLGLALEEAMGQLWRSLIEIMLGQSGHQYSSQELMAQALRELLITKHKIDRKVLRRFGTQLNQTAHAQLSTVSALLLQLLEEQAEPVQRLDQATRDEYANRQSMDETSSDQAGLHDMAGAFKAAIESGDTRAIEPLWDELLTEHAALLERLLRRYGQQAEFRRRLAYGLTHAQLSDILELLEPREHAFVTGVIEQQEQFGPSQASQTRGKDQSIRQLWAFSLGYILVERGSRFNKKSYLSSMLRQMAASENMHFQDLLKDLLENLGDHLTGMSYGTQMRHLLMELKEEQGVAIKETTKSSHSKELREYLMYKQLSFSLANGVAELQGGEARLLEIIVELQQEFPWQLLRILRELQSSAGSWSSTSVRLSGPLLRELVLAFLELTSPAGPVSGSGLLDTVITNAERVKDQHRYFHRLLSCLIKGELIDFEAIMASGKPSDDGAVASDEGSSVDEVESPVRQAAVADFTEVQAEQRLRQFLHGDIELSQVTAVSIINYVTGQLERQPLGFLQSIMLLDADRKQIERLVRLLPEHLLACIAGELAGQSSRRMLQVVELITLACHSKQIGMTPSLLRNIKWEFIFAYLVASGRLFNEQTFVLSYVETLTERAQQCDPQQLRSLLSQQLVVNILPSTREASLRLVKFLSNPDGVSVTAQTTDTASIDSVEPAQAKDPASHEEVYVTNAGMVLAAPYLPRLFEMLGMTEESAFKGLEAQLRAVHLLQYLVNEKSASPEYRLFLNKLLCGVPADQPVPREITPSGQEKELIHGLLQGMIENWKVLGNTSVAGLRESFLQRQGRLQFRDDAWHLRVEPKAFDMLLDQLPWGFSTIKYPWMEGVIYVEWR